MTIEEIRDACLRIENIRVRLEDFLAERQRAQLAAVGSREGMMLLSTTPLMIRDEVLAGWDMQIGHTERGRWEERRNLELPPMQFPYPLTPGQSPSMQRTALGMAWVWTLVRCSTTGAVSILQGSRASDASYRSCASPGRS